MTPDDLEWLKNRLHKDNCRQCDLVRELIASRDSWEQAAVEAHNEMDFQRNRADLYKAEINEQRKATAHAWSVYLDTVLNEKLEDGTPVLGLVFKYNPMLRDRLRKALNQ